MFDGLLNLAGLRFAGGSPRKILIRPNHPRPHALILGQGFIRPLHHRLGFRTFAQDQHSAWLSVPTARHTNNGTVLHLRLAAQRGLEVFGVDVHSRRGDDHMFFAAFEIEIAFRVYFAKVTSAVPAFLAGHWLEFSST